MPTRLTIDDIERLAHIFRGERHPSATWTIFNTILNGLHTFWQAIRFWRHF